MSFQLITELDKQLGSLAWPLGICAVVMLVIILERLILLIKEAPRRNCWLKEMQLQGHAPTMMQNSAGKPIDANTSLDQKCDGDASIEFLQNKIHQSKSMLAKGAELLLRQRHQPHQIREELASLWLAKQQRKLQFGLKLLQVIGIISPLLGLLGTVLGLIEMFASLGVSQGPVTPAMLSSGLGFAMNTTAAGLLIAVPAITAAHLLGIWAQDSCNRIGHILTQINFWLDGICIGGSSNQYKEAAAYSKTSQQGRMQTNLLEGACS